MEPGSFLVLSTSLISSLRRITPRTYPNSQCSTTLQYNPPEGSDISDSRHVPTHPHRELPCPRPNTACPDSESNQSPVFRLSTAAKPTPNRIGPVRQP